MIDEKQIIAARDQIAGLASASIVDLRPGDRVLVPCAEQRTFLCEIRQINIGRDRWGAHWSVDCFINDWKTKGRWNFFLKPDAQLVLIKGAS